MNYQENLKIEGDAFASMRADADKTLQKMISKMVERDVMDGKLTITIEAQLIEKYIENTDPDVQGDTRRILVPCFMHKINSVVSLKDKAEGGTRYDDMEMVLDEETGEFVIKPVANTTQRSIFDKDFADYQDVDTEERESDVKMLESGQNALPAPESKDIDIDEDADEDDVSNILPFGDVGEDEDDYDYDDPE